ncbi:MAG: hypothetical protein ACD_23C01185G0001, partial [uncultured bacterium]
MEQQGAASRVVARDQCQVQLIPGHAGNQGRGLFAVQLDLDTAVLGRKASEHWCQVLGSVVVRHPQAHAPGQFLTMEGSLSIGLQVQHAPGVAQQRLTVRRELELARPPVEQAPA